MGVRGPRLRGALARALLALIPLGCGPAQEENLPVPGRIILLNIFHSSY